jgi:uncharacterized protein involved in type VI secretion and phage assembly
MSERLYELSIDGFSDDRFRVHSFVGKETISEAYSFEIVTTVHTRGDDEVEREALGRRATFILNVGKAPRAFYGVVASLQIEEVHAAREATKIRLRFVPRLWLLKRKKRTRIFQKMRVPDVVSAVLLEAGIATKWQLLRDYPVREYCTQYEETDYRFVTRLLAEAGIYFYFPEGPPVDAATLAAASVAGAVGAVASTAASGLLGSVAGALAGDIASAAAPIIPGDTVVCGDDASWYPTIGGDDAGELAAASAVALASEAGAAIGGDLGAVGSAALGAASTVAGAAVAAAASRAAPPLYFLAMQETTTPRADKITRFALKNSVRADAANFRDYDPDRPMVRLNSAAVSTDPFPPTPEQLAAGAAYTAGVLAQTVAAAGGAAAAALGGVATAANAVGEVLGQVAPASTLETYEHHGPFLFPKWSFANDEAPRILRQKRRRASIANGDSGCPYLAPGHRFALRDHPADHLDRPYVITSVEHRGDTHPRPGELWMVYTNAFECAPAEVTYVPPRPKRKSVQVALTATVVGPPGEEIHVDPMGQIKVQFHWDRDGKYDDKSSCWIRTMQPWGGVGWGVQFIPRIGREVTDRTRSREAKPRDARRRASA